MRTCPPDTPLKLWSKIVEQDVEPANEPNTPHDVQAVEALVAEKVPAGQISHAVKGSESPSNMPARHATHALPCSPSHEEPALQHARGDAIVPFQHAFGSVCESPLQLARHRLSCGRVPCRSQVPKSPPAGNSRPVQLSPPQEHGQ